MDWKDDRAILAEGEVVMEGYNEVPMGLAFQMSMNEKAMEHFTCMTDDEKRQVLEAARSVKSKAEMRSLVDDLSNMC